MSEKEANIQVVVRVRPRNQKEVNENSPVWISTSGIKGKTLNLRLQNNDQQKTYTFDKVFGPEVQQETIFKDVVQDMLEEVLMGYNCTIFAYGQTGAGKTFTMEGNLNDIQGQSAGIIPRTLYQLFTRLESDTAEYTFRVSYVELYNEELRDLLSSPQIEEKKLRIYDDLTRKGSVVINGLEEVLVKNAEDVIAILQKGALKRQTASTKMNESSSRSHCIFSITVHIKESTDDGEELVKIGKLNLVDLAGSENIGRSGAENKRAKEAGMINQSLLTLGRVINALVDRSPHIPYRESRLTRLLQDSLGGKTKTCIIANVSPSKSNIEESISTLDYAHRAKNIRNKPEINQKMTKRTLIKEYVNEIERLKLDLVATREKNGVFMNSQTYKTLIEEHASRQDRLEEFSKSVSAKEELMKIHEENFKKNTLLLNETTKSLNKAKEELEERKVDLANALHDIAISEKKNEEQRLLTFVHETSENNLHDLASGLTESLESTVKDVSGLFEKIDRINFIEKKNEQKFDTFKSVMGENISSLSSLTESFKIVQGQIKDKLDSNLTEFGSSQLDNLFEIQQTIESTFELTKSKIENLTSNSDISYARQSDFIQVIQLGMKDFASKIDSNLRNLEESGHQYRQICSNFVNLFTNEMKTLINEIEDYFRSFNEGVKAHLNDQLDLQVGSTTILKEVVDIEISRLQKENEELKVLLKSEKEKSSAKNKILMEKVMEMFQEQDDSNQKTLDLLLVKYSNSMNESEKFVNSLSVTREAELKKAEFQQEEFLGVIEENIMALEKGFISIRNNSIESFVKVEKINVEKMKEVSDIQMEIFKNLELVCGVVQSASVNELSEMKSSVDARKLTIAEFESSDVARKNELEKMIQEYSKIVEDKLSAVLESDNSCRQNNLQVIEKLVSLNSQINESSLEKYATAVGGETPRKKNTFIPNHWKISARNSDILKIFRGETVKDFQSNNQENVNPFLVDNDEGMEDEEDKFEILESFFVDKTPSANVNLKKIQQQQEIIGNNEKVELGKHKSEGLSKLPRALKRFAADSPWRSRTDNMEDE